MTRADLSGATRARAAGGESVPARLQPASPYLPTRLHAFCVDARTAEIAAKTLAQPRFSALELIPHMGGIPAALSAYAQTPSPDLILIELLLDPAAMLADLDKLAEVCDARSKVIVVGHVNDVRLYRELMRRHISDYLLAPVDGAQLSQSIAMALRGAPAETRGRVVAFMGAKGGCGSSTVCHNTAWVVAELFKTETVIADFDLAFGTLGLDFNQEARQGLNDALAASQKLDSAMIANLLSKCSDQLGLLTASCMLDPDIDIRTDDAARLVELLGQTTAFAALDLPTEWRDWSQALIEMADEVVITAEPDLANLRNAKNLIDTGRALRAVARPPILVINKVGLPRRPEIAIRDFAKAVDLEPTAEIPFDAELFGTAANNGLMIGEVAPKSRHLGLFRSFAGRLSGKAAPPGNGTGLIKPIIQRLGRRLAG